MDTNGFVSGALQVYKDGAFGAICPKNFQAVDADVACKQLGYIGGFALPLAIDRRRAIESLPVCDHLRAAAGYRKERLLYQTPQVAGSHRLRYAVVNTFAHVH